MSDNAKAPKISSAIRHTSSLATGAVLAPIAEAAHQSGHAGTMWGIGAVSLIVGFILAKWSASNHSST